MKLMRVAAVILTAALFLLSGCGSGDNYSFTGIAQSFDCRVEITCMGESLSARISKTAKTVYEFAFVNSDDSEVKISLSGGEVSLLHGNVNYSVEAEILPLAAPFIRISDVLDACDGADSYGQVSLDEEVYTVISETALGGFSLKVDAESLLPLELSIPSADLYAQFTVSG